MSGYIPAGTTPSGEHDLRIIKQTIDRAQLVYGGNGQVAVDGSMLRELVETATLHLQCPEKDALESAQRERDEAQNELEEVKITYSDLRKVAVSTLSFLRAERSQQYAVLRTALGRLTTEELNDEENSIHAHTSGSASPETPRGKTPERSTETRGSGRTGKAGSKPRNP